MLDLRKKTGGAVINNEDITITENGEYTADDGYTGLGTVIVNVSQPPTLKKNCYVINADVDNNGIASNFAELENNSYTSAYGGIAVPYYPIFSDIYNSNTAFQIRFKTPAETIVGWDIVTGTKTKNSNWSGYGGGNDFILSVANTKLKVFGLAVSGREISYNFSPDAWYTLKFASDGTYISTDDGETFTKIDNNSYAVSISTMRETQLGFTADWNSSATKSSACKIDLTKTGWINTSLNISYMFAEV